MFQDTSEIEPLSELVVSARRLLTTLVMLVLCFCAANLTVLAQEVTRSTGGINTPKTSPSPGRSGWGSRRPLPRRTRAITPGVSRGTASEESDNFLNLGDQFAEKGKGHAAEVAYKEAVRLSSSNSDAWVALGYLYVDKGTLSEAYGVYNRLRAIDSKMAEHLLTEIKKK